MPPNCTLRMVKMINVATLYDFKNYGKNKKGFVLNQKTPLTCFCPFKF